LATTSENESAGRKIAMVVELLCQRRIRFSHYRDVYGKEYRSFQRDLQHLRKIGDYAGYTISDIKDRELVELVALDGKTRNLNKNAAQIERLTATIARALGEPIARELGSGDRATSETDDFYFVAMPRLTEGTEVADICATLRAAHSSAGGRAAVRFMYPDGRGGAREREVEPYRLTLRSGNFYLIGYDRGSRDWRTFALDRFRSMPVKAGTCTTARELPQKYASNDVIGFIKVPGSSIAVTVELSPRVAAGVVARTWQDAQQVERFGDGRARITFTVSDVNEVVRWALGFGADARIVAPPDAVRSARETIEAIARALAPETSATGD